MGLFGDSVDRDNSKSRNIRQRKRVSMVDWLPDSEGTLNLSVFGGRDDQRCAVINHAIARMYGKFGIIIIHNDECFERNFQRFPEFYPDVVRTRAKVPVQTISGARCNYDPFCGLDRASIIRCIYPSGGADVSLRAEGLNQYISILAYNNIPLNLQNLVRICSMNLNRIESELMHGIPREEAEDILSILMQNNLHVQVKADVKMFAHNMDGKIWDSNKPSTGISIISAVQNNAILSIKLPSNDANVLNCLAAECSYLVQKEAHFLLIIDNVLLADSFMQEIVRTESNNFAMVFSGQFYTDMLNGARFNGRDLPASLSRKIILFATANSAHAKVYAELCGTFEKIYKTENKKNKVGFFSSDEDNGYGLSKSYTSRIEPDEIEKLRDGAILIQNNYDVSRLRGTDIEKAEYFSIPEMY